MSSVRSSCVLYTSHAYCSSSESDYVNEFEYFLKGKESLRLDASLPEMSGMTKEQVSAVQLPVVVANFHLSSRLLPCTISQDTCLSSRTFPMLLLAMM